MRGRSKAKKRSKRTHESASPGQSKAESNGKIESQIKPDVPRHHQNKAESNGNKESKQTPEAEGHSQTEAEAKGKKGSKKTQETASPGQSTAESNGKIESQIKPDVPRHHQNKAKYNENKESMQTAEAAEHSQNEAKAKGKNRSKKTQESASPGESKPESNGKIESQIKPDVPRHDQNNPKYNGKKGSKQTPEAARQDQNEAEDNLEDEPTMGGTKEYFLQGEWDPKKLAQQGLVIFHTDPYKTHYDIYRFICHSAIVFMCVFGIVSLAILSSGNKLLSTNFDETLWIIVLTIFFIYFVAVLSAMLAVKELPGHLDFIFKFTGIFSLFIAGIFTVIILTRSNLFDIICAETFVNTLNLICFIWWISIACLVVTAAILNDTSKTSKQKVKLNWFVTFVVAWGLKFIFLLIVMMMLLVISGRNRWLGIDFDEMFFKIAISICSMQTLVAISVAYAAFSRKDWAV